MSQKLLKVVFMFDFSLTYLCGFNLWTLTFLGSNIEWYWDKSLKNFKYLYINEESILSAIKNSIY